MSEQEHDSATPAAKAQVTTQEHAVTEKPDGEWEMPEPVYRQSSGYLPQGFEKQFPQPAAAPAATASIPPQSPAADAAATAVEPQPDIIDVLAAEPPIAPVVVRAGRSPVSIVLIIVGLLAMGAVVVGFLLVVFYLFVAAPSETSF